jgi:hypothetical protein
LLQDLVGYREEKKEDQRLLIQIIFVGLAKAWVD